MNDPDHPHRQPHDAPSDDVRGPRFSRRAILTGAAGAVGGVIAKSVLDAIRLLPSAGAAAQQVPSQAARLQVPDDPTKVQGRVPSELGARSRFEQPRRLVNRALPSGESMTPLQDLDGIITPADLHFERHHAGIPEIDPAQYTLLIHGMVDRPMKFTLSDLKRFPSASRICFIECSGNGFPGYHRQWSSREMTPQQLDGLTSTSEWTGVMLSTLFREVGIKPGARWFLAEASDAAVMTRTIPVEKAWNDAMIAYGQNGEAIRPEQGYPARLLLPGWEGNAQVKWIRRIEVSDQPFMTREETSKYTDPLADCTARLFSFVMDAKSVITFPAYPFVLTETGWWEIKGLAWSGRGRITRVDVSTDGGRSWSLAELQVPVLPECHTRFRHLWNWEGRDAVLMSRAVDETGYVQPTRAELKAARGKGTFYHTNNIRGWKVARDGQVFFAFDELFRD